MKQIEQVNVINIPTDEFISKINQKVENYVKGKWDSVISFPPHLEIENVSILNSTLVIRKSIKPFDKLSPYRGISGTIQAEIHSEDDKTVLRAIIMLDSIFATFIFYGIGVVIAFVGIIWFLVGTDFKVLLIAAVAEGVLFGLKSLTMNFNHEILQSYYNAMLKELLR